MTVRLQGVLLLSLHASLAFAAAPFPLANDPRIDPAQFRVTTFASGLHFTTGVEKLSDGSVLVAISDPTGGTGFYSSTGSSCALPTPTTTASPTTPALI